MVPGEGRGDRLHLGARARHGHAVDEPPDYPESAPVPGLLREVRDPGDRLPQVGEPREAEAVGHDANHFRRLAVDPDRPADHRRVGAVAVSPDVPREHDDRRRAGSLVRGPEVPAEDGRLAEQAQAVLGNEDALESRRRPVVLGDGGRRRLVGGQRAERRRGAANVLEVGVRNAPWARAAVPGRDVDHPFRIVDRQAPRRERVEQREELRGDGNPDSQHHDGDDGERPLAGQQTRRETQVLPSLVDPPRAARVAALFLDLVEAAEREASAPARLVLGQARPHVLGHLPLDVVAQLAVQLSIEAVTVSETVPPAHCAPPPAAPRFGCSVFTVAAPRPRRAAPRAPPRFRRRLHQLFAHLHRRRRDSGAVLSLSQLRAHVEPHHARRRPRAGDERDAENQAADGDDDPRVREGGLEQA